MSHLQVSKGLLGQRVLEAEACLTAERGLWGKAEGRQFLLIIKASCLTAESHSQVVGTPSPEGRNYLVPDTASWYRGLYDSVESPFPGPTSARAVPASACIPRAQQPLHSDTAVQSLVCERRVSEGAGQTQRWWVRGEQCSSAGGQAPAPWSPAESRAHCKRMATRGRPRLCLCPQPGAWLLGH